jgi:glycosyltransferase involved in cell wall biosynthesis
MPKVTIGIPVFNESAYIESTLMSALSQFKSYSDLEIVISNNASTDDSFEKINKIIESHIFKNKVKIINQSENIGAANNFWNIFDQTDSNCLVGLVGT